MDGNDTTEIEEKQQVKTFIKRKSDVDYSQLERQQREGRLSC